MATEKRRGTSISLKMILTTALLVLVLVALFGAINTVSITRVYDELEGSLSDSFTRSIEARGRLQTADLAQSSRPALLENNFSALQGYVPQLTKDDREVLYVLVADDAGRVVAHSEPTKNEKLIDDPIAKELATAREFTAKRFDQRKVYGVARMIAQEGRRLGVVIAAYDLKILDEQIKALKARRRDAEAQSITRTVAVGAGFILLGIAISIFQSLRITRPLKMLAWRADQIARGDLETRVETSTSDEIGLLGENFNYMADRLVVLLRETAEKATLEKELELARAIQETLVPPPDLVVRRTISVAGYFLPATQCGGDWWTVNDISPDRLLVVIGDVTGHGVPAAMITAAAKASSDTLRAVIGEKLTVSYLLEVLNRAIHESAKRKYVMTCFASIIDYRARTITYANAGHNFPYILRAGAVAAGDSDVQVLMARGNRLGDLADSTYTEKTEPLLPGDTLVWYTDGIVECENEAGEEYGEKRFRASIRRAASLGPEAMRESIVAAAGQFFGARPRKDDITMVFGRVTA